MADIEPVTPPGVLADDIRRDVETLVRLESPSTDKAAVDRCGAALAGMLRNAGGRVTLMPQADRGDHVRAEFDGGPRRILMLGHCDTVWPVGQIDRMPFREEEGRLYGPGVFDMKGGLAAGVHALRHLVRGANPEAMPHVVLLCTTDEEIGSGTSRALIEEEARHADAVLVLEPSLPGGAVKTARKGCGEFVLTVHGVSAHAGIDPLAGASAVHELAHQIVALRALNDPERGISINIGVVHGGTRGNVIAEHASAVVDVRVPTSADGERIQAVLSGLTPQNPRVRLEITGGVERPPLERTAAVVALYQQAREVARRLGRELEEGETGGGSDGNFTAALGVPTLDGLGPEGGGAHALHEHVVVDDLAWRATFLARLMSHINGRIESWPMG